MFVDSVTLSLSAGKGGNGIVAWRREKYVPKGGPAGGDGGKGGSITIKANPQIYSLEDFRNTYKIKAQNGGGGGPNNRKGKNGKDIDLFVPLGTLVKDAKTKEILFDFTDPEQELLICKGGKGGKGNTFFKSSTNRAPNKCTEGTEGTSIDIDLELKLIADIGLVGMPNAGKSTLISKITCLPVKIAPYPFTTLRPNLGLLEFEDFTRVLIADIPGIIKDAHINKGLGLSFLKHVERTKALLFVIDISKQERKDPMQDFLMLRDEIRSYNPKMLEKSFLVALNKIDTQNSEEHISEFRKKYPFEEDTLFEISAEENINLEVLKKKLKEKLTQEPNFSFSLK